MKRILWVCNIMLPVIAQKLHLPYSSREGWLSGIFEKVKEKEAPFELGVCFPVEDGGENPASGEEAAFLIDGVKCYAFLENLKKPEKYNPALEKRFADILQDFKPDILHIFGTEFPHTLAAVRAFGNSDRILLGIQGLCGEIAKVYMAGLPEKVQRAVTFRDFVRKDSIRRQQEKFVLRGQNEAEAIRGCSNITGRTRFDREGTAAINPKARYYHMNETMRKEFYTGSWDEEKCEAHSIFLGQGDYPLKGMHFVLEAMAVLLPDYPDLRLYVAGNSVVEHQTLKQRLKLSAYGKYLLKLMRKYKLTDRVTATGKLTAQEMKERFLRCSVFVCASVLENSPNTVGEAMLLGVPVAASRAGGIPDMITDGKEGLLFEAGDAGALAEAIRSLWSPWQDEHGLTTARRISKEAAARAAVTHDGERNYLRLLEIYGEIGAEK